MIRIDFKNTLTYKLSRIFVNQIFDFVETLGIISIQFIDALKYIFTLNLKFKQILKSASIFAFDSLPITLTIVGLTTIIITMQVAPELVKQGGGKYIGMLVALVMIRELSNVMAGFAIISMIGSAYASEVATMKVTDQIDAMKALKVDPIKYLFAPRLVSGFIMMPMVFIITSFVGLICGWATTMLTTHGVSTLGFIESVWEGLELRDIFIALLKASVFGFSIVLVSLSCGIMANGGAKGVGIATTKAVVWSFITIAVIDYLFALIFYF